MIPYPLTKAHRIRIARAFRHVPRVDLSIDCIVEEQMGRAFVDNLEDPRAFKLELGPFFYFAGTPETRGGRAMLEKITPYTLFMPSAPGWLEAAQALYRDRLGDFERYTFSSAGLSKECLNLLYERSPFRGQVRRMDHAFVASLWGQDHFVDLSDFDSAEDFLQRSIGFFIQDHETVTGAAFGALVCSRGIEVSIFVVPDYREQGVATALGSRLLLWCLENGVDPHWDAANPESYRLAKKLGYVPAGRYDVYYLSEP